MSKWWRIGPALLCAICSYLSLLPLKEEYGKAMHILICILCLVAGWIFFDNWKTVSMLMDSLWKKVLGILCFCYFNFSIYGIVFLEDYGMDGYPLPHILYIPIAVIWSIPLYFGLLAGLLHYLSKEVTAREGLGLSLKGKAIGFVTLMGHYALWIYAFNPCISSFDTGYLYDQAHFMGTVPMPNAHPPFYTIVMSFLIGIYDSVTFFVLLQCLAFSLLLVGIIDYLLRKGCSQIEALFLYLFLGFLPNNVLQMITLWKDIPYMIALLWLTFLLSQLILEKGKVDGSWYAFWILSMVFTGFFRQNGILPISAVLVILIPYFVMGRKWKGLLSAMVVIICVVLINGPIYSYYKVEPRPGFKYYALANDLLGTYYQGAEVSEEVLDIVNEITENDPDDFPYTAYYTVNNNQALHEYSTAEFLSIYLNTFFSHPRELILQVEKRNTILWSIAPPALEYPGCVNYTDEYHSPDATYQYPSRVENRITGILSAITKRITQSSFLYVFIWRTGLYSLLLIVMVLLMICKQKWRLLLPFVPIAFHEISLYAGSGWSDYRYVWPIEVVGLFLIIFGRCVGFLQENKQG